MMRFFLSVFLAAAALADSEPYTIGQAFHGYGRGIITGVDYGHGVVSGYGAIGNRGYYGGVHGVYGGVHGYYGKREADSDSDAYTIGQVHAGLPVANAWATGHPHNVGVITNVGYSGYGHGLYGGYYGGYYGKREADSDAYTIGQVYSGYAPGVVTGVDYGHGLVSGYGAIGNRGYYGGVHGVYGGVHGYYGKREADSDAYTIGQVAYGLPVHNAYATGHPHNVGVITGVSHSGYGYAGAFGGYGGYFYG